MIYSSRLFRKIIMIARERVDRDPLAVGVRLDPALHTSALDRAPPIDDRSARLVLRTRLVDEPAITIRVDRRANRRANLPAPRRLGLLALPVLALTACISSTLRVPTARCNQSSAVMCATAWNCLSSRTRTRTQDRRLAVTLIFV